MSLSNTFSFLQQFLRNKITEIRKFRNPETPDQRSKFEIFVLKRKEMFRLIKKLFLSFTQFSIFTILSTDACIPFLYFCRSLILVSKKPSIETMLNLPYSNSWQKFNKINEKRSQEYQGMGPEYVTWQINSRILELLLRRFCRLIFAPSRKS